MIKILFNFLFFIILKTCDKECLFLNIHNYNNFDLEGYVTQKQFYP